MFIGKRKKFAWNIYRDTSILLLQADRQVIACDNSACSLEWFHADFNVFPKASDSVQPVGHSRVQGQDEETEYRVYNSHHILTIIIKQKSS